MTVVSATKSLIVLGLAALAIYLAAQLWFVNITDRSFLPYLQARFSQTVSDGGADFVRPFRIIYGAGDGYFDIQYSNIANSDTWNYGRAVIAAALSSASFVGTHDTSMAHILSQPVFIYQYAFYMDSVVLSQAFNQREGTTLTGRGLYNIRAVAVRPPYNGRTAINVFFIGDTQVLEFSLAIDARQREDFGVTVPSAVSSRRRFAHSGDALVFVPRFHRNFVYNPVRVTNPYNNHAGLLHLAFIRSQMEHFFDNPATINHGLTNFVYTFSNLNTVVRYLPGNVVEYTSFRTIGRASPTTFLEDFSAALAFVEADPHVNIEFFLARYEMQGRETVFWFDYAIGNFPLIMAEPWPTHPDCLSPLTHAIEVTVDNGRVVRYRRLAYNFALDTNAITRPDWAISMGDAPLGFFISAESHIRLEAM